MKLPALAKVYAEPLVNGVAPEPLHGAGPPLVHGMMEVYGEGSVKVGVTTAPAELTVNAAARLVHQKTSPLDEPVITVCPVTGLSVLQAVVRRAPVAGTVGKVCVKRTAA